MMNAETPSLAVVRISYLSILCIMIHTHDLFSGGQQRLSHPSFGLFEHTPLGRGRQRVCRPLDPIHRVSQQNLIFLAN